MKGRENKYKGRDGKEKGVGKERIRIGRVEYGEIEEDRRGQKGKQEKVVI